MQSFGSFCGAVILLLATLANADVTIRSVIASDSASRVVISWEAVPGKVYVVKTKTNLEEAWVSAVTEPYQLTAVTNTLSYSFPVTLPMEFFRVTKVDSEAPEIQHAAPNDGGIAVSRRASLQVFLRDETGIDPDTIVLTLKNGPNITLSDSRLAFTNGVLSYTPADGETFGDLGEIVNVGLSVCDTLGNCARNLGWSFQLELAAIFSTNIVYVGRAASPSRLASMGAALTLVATNGDTFTFRYSGVTSGLTNGQHLIDSDLQRGYTRTVVEFTECPDSNTVAVLTRPTKLAELLEQGSFSSSGSYTQRLDSIQPTGIATIELPFEHDFPIKQNLDLAHVLYDDENFMVEIASGSELTLSASLSIGGNFRNFRLTEFVATVTGQADFDLNVHARAKSGWSHDGVMPLIQPIRRVYGGVIGVVPVWLEVVWEFNLGYSAGFQAQADFTAGVRASKEILMERRFDGTNWYKVSDNARPTFAITGPTWEIEGSASLRAYVQPKVTLFVYSIAGVFADLQPYLELPGRLQLNPYYWEADLYSGLQATLGLDLRVWDDHWGELPNQTFDLIPRAQLWHRSLTIEPPEIIAHPQNQRVGTGRSADFTVVARGTQPLQYQWQRNGLNLSDDYRISGSRSSTLRIASSEPSDAADYRVIVRNQAGSLTSSSATLTVVPFRPILKGAWPGYTRGEAVSIAISGRYAYLVWPNGLHILDVSNPANPIWVGQFEANNSVNAAQVVGRYAYLAAGEAGLQIVDIGDPRNPLQ